jgi:hypothetical protein
MLVVQDEGNKYFEFYALNLTHLKKIVNICIIKLKS